MLGSSVACLFGVLRLLLLGMGLVGVMLLLSGFEGDFDVGLVGLGTGGLKHVGLVLGCFGAVEERVVGALDGLSSLRGAVRTRRGCLVGHLRRALSGRMEVGKIIEQSIIHDLL